MLLARAFEGGPPELAGRPHEAVGNGSPRWMVADRDAARRAETEPGLQAGSSLARPLTSQIPSAAFLSPQAVRRSAVEAPPIGVGRSDGTSNYARIFKRGGPDPTGGVARRPAERIGGSPGGLGRCDDMCATRPGQGTENAAAVISLGLMDFARGTCASGRSLAWARLSIIFSGQHTAYSRKGTCLTGVYVVHLEQGAAPRSACLQPVGLARRCVD
jgi:hypothetical protein